MLVDYKIVREVAKRVFRLRIPGTRLHRLLLAEYQLRSQALNELARIFYYQPMFESVCRKVGPELRLEISPGSRFPCLANVELELGRHVQLSARTTITGARNAPSRPRVVIGDYTYIGDRVVLRAGTEILIGRHVLFATDIMLSGDPGHPLDAVARRTQPAPREALGRIELGDDVWIAYNATVVGNVRIGEGAVVGANAVVTKDVPPYTLVAGNPARVLRELRPDRPVRIEEAGLPAQKVPRAAAGTNVLREAPEELFGGAPPRPDARPAATGEASSALRHAAEPPPPSR